VRGKETTKKTRRRWIDKFKVGISGIGLSGLDGIGLDRDRYRWRALVNAVMNFRVP
jgi:hypothetical protein